MLIDTNYFTSILHPNFRCISCDFVCSKKGDWNRHIVTSKHTRLTNPNNFTSKNIKPNECNCGKVYKHKSSLSLHKKTCIDKKEIIRNVLKELQELAKDWTELKDYATVYNDVGQKELDEARIDAINDCGNQIINILKKLKNNENYYG